MDGYTENRRPLKELEPGTVFSHMYDIRDPDSRDLYVLLSTCGMPRSALPIERVTRKDGRYVLANTNSFSVLCADVPVSPAGHVDPAVVGSRLSTLKQTFPKAYVFKC